MAKYTTPVTMRMPKDVVKFLDKAAKQRERLSGRRCTRSSLAAEVLTKWVVDNGLAVARADER